MEVPVKSISSSSTVAIFLGGAGVSEELKANLQLSSGGDLQGVGKGKI